MKTVSRLFLCFLPLLASVLTAEPVTLSRTEDFELHDALTTLEAGLTPENTLAAADDLLALEADAKAYRMAYIKLLQLQNVANAQGATAEQIAAFKKADEDFAAKADAKKTYDLTMLNISKPEIGAAKIAPRQLTTIKRLLKPDPKPAETKK